MESEYLQRLDVQGHLKAISVLVRWDPVQTSEPGRHLLEQEFEGHAIDLVALLDSGASADRLVKYLQKLCVEQLHRPFNAQNTHTAVAELLDFWPQWKKQLAESADR